MRLGLVDGAATSACLAFLLTACSESRPAPVVDPYDGSVPEGPKSTLSAADGYTCIVLPTGWVSCWGRNANGRLGDGTRTSRLVPGPVTGITDAVEVASGQSHSCARRAGGAIACWGAGFLGQLGDGTEVDFSTTPVAVTGIGDARQVVVGTLHSCALLADGHVECWGANGARQIGSGYSVPTYTTPFPVQGLTDVVELAAARDSTCARRTSGDVVCWGAIPDGGLGWIGLPTPTPVAGLTDAVELAGGLEYMCARRRAGSVVCWGNNVLGQLGDGTRTGRVDPAPVVDLHDAVELAAGTESTCARRRGGDVVCWGHDGFGALGDGTGAMPSVQPVPGPVAELTDAIEISVGDSHACARRFTGAVVCWGDNREGQLGDGTMEFRFTPTAVYGSP